MHRYMEVSTKVYGVYLKYIAPEDIHVYSCDEVFIDATAYLGTYKCSARDLAMRMVRDVLATTGITATAGIGTNMFLAKVAMDVEAKLVVREMTDNLVLDLVAKRLVTDRMTLMIGYDIENLTDARADLDEEQMFALNATLSIIVERLNEHPKVCIGWFRKDARKKGGEYVKTVGSVRNVDLPGRLLILKEGARISLDDIVSIVIL